MDDALPAALRVGSPLNERDDNRRESTSSGPRRPSSAVSPIPESYSRGGTNISSYSSSRRASAAAEQWTSVDARPPKRFSTVDSLCESPVQSAPSSSPFTLPSAPPLPSFSRETSYSPISPFESEGSTPASQPVKKQSLISKLGSIRTNRLSKRNRYGVLHDDAEAHGHQELQTFAETESIDYDISGLDGYTHLGQEVAGHGALGGGMNDVRSFDPSPGQRRHKRGLSATDQETRAAVQKIAEAKGEIIVVEEPTVDISNFGGADYSQSTKPGSVPTQDGSDTQKSYFFPEDPEKPAWRPFSMKWPYITLLIVIAAALAVVQEVLCQLSIRRASKNTGLLEFKHPNELSIMQYFVWKYLPTLVLVTYGVMWQVADFEIKRLEPFYQLSKRSGATARDSLNQDYLTSITYLIPFKALRCKQWAVFFSSVATLLAGGIVPVLQSGSVVLLPDKKKRQDDEPKFVRINGIWSRAMSGALLCIAIYGVLLLIQLRRKSGLLSDPQGIAGIAAMATKSHILNDLKGLDLASNADIDKQLNQRRYNLHKSSLWQGEYIRHDEKLQAIKVENPHPPMLRLLFGVPFIVYMVAFACVVPVFVFVPTANLVTEKVSFLLTALATIVKLLWGSMDMNLRVVEPYYVLSRRHAAPRTLTLDYTGTVPGWLTVKAFTNKHWLIAMVGFGSILTEVLTVCVSSFSVDGRKFISGHGGNPTDHDNNDRYNTSETFKSFWVSFALVMIIIAYLCAVASLVYAYRRHKFLPRQPGTIAGILAYIHQSRMLSSFVNTHRMDGRQMTKHLESLKKTYGLGWFNGRDGEDHCGIDEEPLLASYKHGYDWPKSRLIANQIGTWDVY
ncbi:hypothetical protein EJ06DRAFT_532051 [Trichodelitschia bisporula]|uniref:Uncharacterized protein n=1 Tax=Trichodelitschia bisporula TaxID=703511 RepID=A0A6G1HQH4_9PEZI|nr:hypothetical protein EJ06DRAFT_532051 [Trichodelitschia bisporula]